MARSTYCPLSQLEILERLGIVLQGDGPGMRDSDRVEQIGELMLVALEHGASFRIRELRQGVVCKYVPEAAV